MYHFEEYDAKSMCVDCSGPQFSIFYENADHSCTVGFDGVLASSRWMVLLDGWEVDWPVDRTDSTLIPSNDLYRKGRRAAFVGREDAMLIGFEKQNIPCLPLLPCLYRNGLTCMILFSSRRDKGRPFSFRVRGSGFRGSHTLLSKVHVLKRGMGCFGTLCFCQWKDSDEERSVFFIPSSICTRAGDSGLTRRLSMKWRAIETTQR